MIWSLIAAAVVALCGALLMLWALFPKRVGATPYCARCRYNLTGIDWESPERRCPECGHALDSERTVRRGERHRSPRRIVLAALPLLIGLLPLLALGAGALWDLNWYRYKPTDWVIADVSSANSKLANKAVLELQRRWVADELHAAQLSACAESLLSEQARPNARRSVLVAAVFLLDRIYKSEQLSAQQADRYFSQMELIQPVIRPVVVAGDPLYAGVRLDDRGPFNSYELSCDLERVRIDGVVQSAFIPCSSSGCTGSGGLKPGGCALLPLEEGEHAVELDVRVKITRRGATDSVTKDPADVLFERATTVRGTVTVLANETPGLFKETHSPELDRALAEHVTLSDFHLDHKARTLEARLGFKRPFPIGLAADVYAAFNGHRLLLYRAAVSPHEEMGTVGIYLTIPLPPALPPAITVIVRSSRAAALETPDLYEIWDGELWFEDVAVVDDAPPKGWGSNFSNSPEVRRRELSAGAEEWPEPAFHPEMAGLPISLRSSFPDDLISDWTSIDSEVLSGIDGAQDEQLPDWARALLQGKEHSGPSQTQPALDWFTEEIEALAPSERDAYFEELLGLSLCMRPQVVVGQDVIVGIKYAARDDSHNSSVRVEIGELHIGDGRTIPMHTSMSFPLGVHLRMGNEVGQTIRFDKPGRWPVSLDVSYKVTRNRNGGSNSAAEAVLHSGKCTLTGEIEVFAEERPEMFSAVYSPALDRAVRNAISATDFWIERGAGSLGAHGSLMVQVWLKDPLPTGIAFDVYVAIDGREIEAESSVTGYPGGSAGTSQGAYLTSAYDGDPPDTATLILRSSKAVTLRTPDLFEIWDGELRFENIPVGKDAPDASPFSRRTHAGTVSHPVNQEDEADGE